MIREALQYLVGLKANKTYSIGGKDYSDNKLVQVFPTKFYPNCICTTSLDSVVKMVQTEMANFQDTLPLYIHVEKHNQVKVFTGVDGRMERNYIVKSEHDGKCFSEGYRNQSSAIIELRSRFVPNDGVDYLLSLISRISKESTVASDDNGVSQTVEARGGVYLKTTEVVKPRVALRPFRTFLEVEQPESEFILRLNDTGDVGLFEADGGMWKQDAKQSIVDYFEKELEYEITENSVVVMM